MYCTHHGLKHGGGRGSKVEGRVHARDRDGIGGEEGWSNGVIE